LLEPTLISIALYAEIHFNPIPGLSRLYHKEPEIITDIPWRLEPGETLPLLCLVKDADKFPADIGPVFLELYDGEGKLRFSWRSEFTETVKSRFWWRIFPLELPEDLKGRFQAKVGLHLRQGTREKLITGHNYRRSGRHYHVITLSEHPLPRTPGWYLGDIHHHSYYTDDQAEFGSPPEATSAAARALGLDWVAITDHSYDLDDREGDPRAYDPHHGKWERFRQEVQKLNRENTRPLLVPGEEISVGNQENRNVHLLALGHERFIPGRGDDAEKVGLARPTISLEEALGRLAEQNALAFAAHPREPVPFLEGLLLRRGRWTVGDLKRAGLTGLQVMNGDEGPGFEKGLDTWRDLLLKGHQLGIVAGTDSHGNFNRMRQLRLPGIKLKESETQVLGWCWTGVRSPGGLSLEGVMAGLRNNRAMISTGPFIELAVTGGRGERVSAGGSIPAGTRVQVSCLAVSSPEFGRVESIKLFWGGYNTGRELKLQAKEQKIEGSSYRKEAKVLFRPPCNGYLRAEVSTSEPARLALSNPVWVQAASK